MGKQWEEAVAVILCGGKSSRMGFDKTFLKEENGFFLLKTAQAMNQLFPRVVFLSNQREKFEGKLGFSSYPIWEDHYPEKGPLGGICTAMEEEKAACFFVLACDMPFQDLELIQKMHREIKNHQVVICKVQGRFEPLFAFYHRSCLPVFQRQIQEGQLRIRQNFDQLQVKEILLGKEKAKTVFWNLNTPEDLEKFFDSKKH